MRPQPDKIERVFVCLAVDEYQVRLDMAVPVGLWFPNKINSLGRPTPQNRALFLKDNFARCPTCPTLPEADNPLLDAWLSSNDPIAWIGLLGGETIDD